MKNKKQRILVGLCTPIAIVGTTLGTVGLVLGLKKSPNQKPEEVKVNKATIKFDAGEGQFTQGSKTVAQVPFGKTLNDVSQPVVKAPKGKVFAGWENQFGERQQNRNIIRNNTTLKAVYNGDTDEYAIIHFKDYVEGIEGSTPYAKLNGNATLSIAKGHHFYMANRPEATAKDNADRTYTFEGWKYAYDCGEHIAGDVVSENDEIRYDMTIVPYFTAAVTVTFDTSDGSKIISGNNKQVTAEGTQFGDINQPGLSKTSGESALYFIGWFDEKQPENWSSMTEEEKEAWIAAHWIAKDTPINNDMTVYPGWSSSVTPGSEYCLISFVEPVTIDGSELPSGDKWEYTPTDTILVTKGTKWSDVFTPTCHDTKAYYQQSGWQYSEDDGTTWNYVYDESVITWSSNIKVRALMGTAVDGVQVSGKGSLLPGQTADYTLLVNGVDKALGTISWEILTQGGEKVSEDIALISTQGDGTGHLQIFGSVEDELTIRVVGSFTMLGKTYKDEWPVTINKPYIDSKNIWYHGKNTEGKKQWYQINPTDLCSKSSTINYYDITGTLAGTINKSDDFEYDLVLGDLIQLVGENFAYGWTGFTGNVTIQDSVKYIGKNFMYGCTNFVGDKTNFDKMNLTQLGDNFLAGCTSFAGDFAIPNSNISYIGSNCLAGCTSFDGLVWLPSRTELTILDHFLYGCTSFGVSHGIDLIPANLVYVGDYFMHNCDSLQGEIPVEYGLDIDNVFVGETYDFSTSNKEAPTLSTGFKFRVADPIKRSEEEPYQPTEDEKKQFLEKLNARYPTLNNETTIAWRKNNGSSAAAWTQEEFMFAIKNLDAMVTSQAIVNIQNKVYDTNKGEFTKYGSIDNIRYKIENDILEQSTVTTWKSDWSEVVDEKFEHQLSNYALGSYILSGGHGYIDNLYEDPSESPTYGALNNLSFFYEEKYQNINNWSIQSLPGIGTAYVSGYGRKDQYIYFQADSSETPTIKSIGGLQISDNYYSYKTCDFDYSASPIFFQVTWEDPIAATVVTSSKQWTYTTGRDITASTPLYIEISEAKLDEGENQFDVIAESSGKKLVLNGNNPSRCFDPDESISGPRPLISVENWWDGDNSKLIHKVKSSSNSNAVLLIAIVPADDGTIPSGTTITITKN